MKLIKEVNTQGYFSWQNGLQHYSADEICDVNELTTQEMIIFYDNLIAWHCRINLPLPCPQSQLLSSL